ncbi:unnamed protein product [Microthlaspi erraticum]|uniref:Uncharacterized protein n=1 Tax=Microthlaspi erraticum TaxID=1685480 RepID=A0A6D2KEG8_9BRAS|nr:unnamed protein product [Microthlaspi erraticum]
MDGYGNGNLSKEDQRRSVEEESARGQREDKVRGVCKGQREDRVRGGKASSKMGRDTGTMERRDGKINTLGLEDKDVGSNPEITTKTWIKTGSRTIEQN